MGINLPEYYGKRNAVVGHHAFASRGLLDFQYPIGEKGKIIDFESFEDLLSYTAEQLLRCEMKGSSVLLCETHDQDKKVRERETEILFESFQVDSAYLSVSSILAMYTTGRTSGIIVECGAGRTLIIPVFEGYPLPHAVVEHCCAGRDMATHLAKRITEHEKNHKLGVDLDNAYGVYLVESALIEKVMNFTTTDSALEDAASLSLNKDPQNTSAKQSPSSTYALPDGREVQIDETMIRECREMYFSPDASGTLSQINPPLDVTSGIVQQTETCLQKLDREVRHVGDSFVFTGGVAGCKGFSEQFAVDIEPVYSKYIRTQRSLAKVCVSWRNGDVKHPCYMAWHGGSILASLHTFGSMWVSKTEYEETGPTIVHRKCF